MKKWRILIAEPGAFSIDAIDLLQEIALVECRSLSQKEVRNALNEYDVVWIRLHLQIRATDIGSAPRCRWIVSATTGTDHIDVSGLKASGVDVLTLRSEKDFLETIGVTAELTLGLLLALVRKVPAAFGSVVCQGRWDRDAFRGIELSGRTAGIVGLGRLGRKMVRYLSALGMRVVGWDPYALPVDGVEQASGLDELLRQSHVVTIHVPLNEETKGMFDASRFAVMRKGAFFINTSRGALVDEQALHAALLSGHLGGAALDVLCGEPDIGLAHPLVNYAANHENLLITPHLGGAVEGIMARCELHMAQKLANILLQQHED